MSPIPNAFIVEPINQGWIIERLMRDVAAELNRRGIPTRIGPAADYAGEAVIFNSRFLTPLRDARAIVNGLFITHVDDSIKERELQASFDRFNSLVCISPQDADFVAGLRGDGQGVVGIDLPARDLVARPLRVALFSACYADGRKNESWIPAYFEARPREVRDGFVFCFLGSDWEPLAARLAALDLNFEVLRYARSMPGEYQQYKERLAGMDALVYPGFDGGAMSVYDGLAAGIEVLASDTSYHRGLGDSVTLFSDRDGFFAALDHLHARRHARATALQGRSVAAYVDRLLAHWKAVAEPGKHTLEPVASADSDATVALFRSRYKRLSLSRLRSALIRAVQSRVLK